MNDKSLEALIFLFRIILTIVLAVIIIKSINRVYDKLEEILYSNAFNQDEQAEVWEGL